MTARRRRKPVPVPQNDANAFELTLEGTQDAVRAALGTFMDKLAPLGLTCQDRGNVELVMAEALNNIVEHAFGGHQQVGFIRVSCSCQQRALCLDITDFGNPMPGLALPAVTSFELDAPVSELPEGGFGWGLIHSLTDDIVYRRAGPLNTLSLRIPLQSH